MRVRAGWWVAGVIVVIAATACLRRPVVTLVDATTEWCSDVVTKPERELIEEIARDQARKLTRAQHDPIAVELVCSDKLPGLAATEGHTIRLSAGFVRTLLDEASSETARKSRLAFVIGHELGHMVTPECADVCAEAFVCEQRADELAIRAGGTGYGTTLSEVGRLKHDALKAQLDATVPAVDAARAAGACLAGVEVELRYRAALGDDASQGRSSWHLRAQLRDLVKSTNGLGPALARYLDVCSDLIRRLPDADTRACRLRRVDTVRAALAGDLPVPELTSEHWRSPISRWTDDALVHVSLDGAPGWWIPAPEDGDDHGFFARRQPAWITRLFVGYEGGIDQSIGLRLGYGRSTAAADPSTSYRAEVAGQQPVWLLGRHAAVVGDAGIGADYRSAARNPGLGFLGTVGMRLAVRLGPRIRLAAGFVLGFVSHDTHYEVSAPVTLDVHLGSY